MSQRNASPWCRILLASVLATLPFIASGALATAAAAPQANLSITIVGGPAYTVEQSNPTSTTVIEIPAGDHEPLLIRAIITNNGAVPFVGIPSQTLFTTTAGDPFLLSGVTGIVGGVEVFEGQELTDQPATAPFIGGFVLQPGESREFTLHLIYGLLCPGCEGQPGPVLETAPCGTTNTLIESTFDIRTGQLVGGEIFSDPDVVPDIRLVAGGPYPLTVTVTCQTPAQLVALLSVQVQELVDNGQLRPASARPLLNALRHAHRALVRDRPFLAGVHLRVFIALVRIQVRIGRLGAAEGAALVASAQEILQQLQP